MKFYLIFVMSVFMLVSLNACVAPSNTAYNNNPSTNTYQPKTKDTDKTMIEKWYLTKINNKKPQGPRVTLELNSDVNSDINSDMKLSGFSGCNRYFGSVELLENNQVKIGRIASTRKRCVDQNSNQLERNYLSVLGGVKQMSKSNSQLELMGNTGTLTFLKKSAR